MKKFYDAIYTAWQNFDEGLKETPDPSKCEIGGLQLTDRLAYLAEICAAEVPGDLVEIGAWTGYTTQRLVKIAQRFGRKVIVIDPWEGENEFNYQIFRFNLESAWQSPHLVVFRYQSQHEDMRTFLQTPLCFVYIDGEHTYEAVKTDIESTRHCKGIVACDDLNWNGGIRQAFCETRNKIQIRNSLFREGYLIPAI